MAGPYYDNVQLPGADGIRIPTEVYGSAGAGVPGATMEVFKEVDLAASAFVSNAYTLTPGQAMASYFTMPLTGLSANTTLKFPVCQPGNSFVVCNNSGHSVTVMVTGKTGVTLSTGSQQTFMHDGLLGDIVANAAAVAATAGA